MSTLADAFQRFRATPKGAALEAFRPDVEHCQRCPLHATRQLAVFGEGNPESPLVLVGEGPGDQEDRTGRPFVGRSGQLLDAVLLECGLDRRYVYICNTVKCRAHDRIDGRAVNRPPAPSEIAACRPWLEKQLQVIQPLVIVCIGAPSARTLIDPAFSITRQRGEWFTGLPHAPAVTATFHPAYVLRQEGTSLANLGRLMIQDIMAARQRAAQLRTDREARMDRGDV